MAIKLVLVGIYNLILDYLFITSGQRHQIEKEIKTRLKKEGEKKDTLFLKSYPRKGRKSAENMLARKKKKN